MRRFFGMSVLVALLATTAAAPVAAVEPGDLSLAERQPTRIDVIHGSKSQSGRIAQSDADLLARNDAAIVNVMVKVDVDAAATYRGGIKGLPPTSPSVTGRSLSENAAAVAAYKRYVAGKADAVKRAVSAALPRAVVGRNFTIAFGGFAARIPANQARNLAGIDGVAAVMYDNTEKITTDATPEFIGAEQLWPSIGGSQRAGEGVKVGVLDTGIWPEHPSFTDPGISHPGGTYACEFGGSGHPDDAPFSCNDKLIGAYAFLDTYTTVLGPDPNDYCTSVVTCSARDADGHGTHTSSTAAGRRLSSAILFGVQRGPISGIAPGAHIIHYRVCRELGCFQSDSVDAVEQAISDDVDVLNFSISGGSDPYSDPVELAFLDAYAAGILVNASAGNSGPDSGTANHGGPWTNTVGASTSDRHFVSTLQLTADGGASLDVEGVTITAGISSPTDVVLASDAPYSDELCSTPAAPGTFTGKVVVCKRGVVGRAEKGFNVDQGDAAGMILYNASAGQTDLETDNHWLPAIHVQFDGGAVADFVDNNTDPEATWSTGVATHVTGDVMASFSSRGPLGDFIKPDVTAPGIQILAGHSPQHHANIPAGGPNGELFQAIAGTSMSSPHAAGVAALLKDAHPSWTPGQIKSAMMTQSVQSVLKEDGVTPADPFDRGAGSIRANRANKPVVTFDVPASQYYDSAGDEDGRIHLNLASVNAPNMPGIITTQRTARNATNLVQTIDISATGPSGARITINPTTLTLNPWQEKSFFITIDGKRLEDGQYFGQLTLNPRRSGEANAILPVAFNKQPGEVTVVNTCEDDTVARGSVLDCAVTVQNFAAEPANVSLRVKGPRSRNLLLRNWDDGNKKGNGFVWNGQLSESIAPVIISLTPGHGPAGGYLPLTLFGVPGEGFYGDETIANYSGFGTFSFGHELYDTIGVTSNGYLVVGGGESEDLNYIPHDFPNPVRPNNVLAPYWTDLNPGSAGDIYLAILSDGTTDWLVVDWEGVPVYPGPANPRSFQVWIQLGGTTDEGIWFEHGSDSALQLGSIDGLIVGAENRDGTSGADLGLNVPPANTGYEVITGSPTPGGSKTINYEAKGVVNGTYTILSTVTADIMQGTATDRDRIKVVSP